MTILCDTKGCLRRRGFTRGTLSLRRKITCALTIGMLTVAGPALAVNATGSESVLYRFTGGSDGGKPHGALIAGKTGVLYGTTMMGGSLTQCSNAGCGTVFSLTPPGAGQTSWVYTVLYAFKGGTDGAVPMSALVMDAYGNMYGTTKKGGGTLCGGYGCGTVFMLSPPATPQGMWTYKTLHSFTGVSFADAAQPEAELVVDSAGNLLGTSMQGGANNQGAVFRLSPPAPGSSVWAEQILHSFTGGPNGGHISGPVTLDALGNVYGTAAYGGSTGAGLVYELTRPASGSAWPYKILYNFPGGAGGGYPRGSLTFDSSGNLYSTATNIAFELSPQANGSWTESTIYSFSSFGDANIPFAGMTLVTYPGTFALFGTAGYGTSSRVGAVFKLAAPNGSNANWHESLLYEFSGGADGANAFGGLLASTSTLFYGTTSFGGNVNLCDFGCGVVYAVTP